MRNAFLKWIAGLSVAVCQSVSAVPITDTVIVGTQEWAQVNLFTNVSWNDLNAQCPGGVCTVTSTINGYDLDGWTWASVDTVQSLFNEYTGQATVAPGIFSAVGSTWAPAFISDFAVTFSDRDEEGVYGYSSSEYAAAQSFALTPLMLNQRGQLAVDFAFTNDVQAKGVQFPRVGAWFVRRSGPTPAPVPATLTLFGLGLASLWMTRRKIGAKV